MQDLTLKNERLDGENFEAYKERRKVENRIVRGYLRDGLMVWNSQGLSDIKGKRIRRKLKRTFKQGNTFTYEKEHGISRSEYRLNKLKERRG